MTATRVTTLRYCPYERLLIALALGWRYVADLGDRQGAWACLIEWPCAVPEAWPPRELQQMELVPK